MLVGASRKGFIGQLTSVDDPADRLAGTLAVHLAAVARGASLLRVHDVAAHRQALDVWESIESPATATSGLAPNPIRDRDVTRDGNRALVIKLRRPLV